MAHEALGAHAREESGIFSATATRPLQTACASATSFIVGELLPLTVAVIVPDAFLIPSVAIAALISLAFLGGLAAKTGSAKKLLGVMRVTFWSVFAMNVTSSVEAIFATEI